MNFSNKKCKQFCEIEWIKSRIMIDIFHTLRQNSIYNKIHSQFNLFIQFNQLNFISIISSHFISFHLHFSRPVCFNLATEAKEHVMNLSAFLLKYNYNSLAKHIECKYYYKFHDNSYENHTEHEKCFKKTRNMENRYWGSTQNRRFIT